MGMAMAPWVIEPEGVWVVPGVADALTWDFWVGVGVACSRGDDFSVAEGWAAPTEVEVAFGGWAGCVCGGGVCVLDGLF